MNFFKKFQKLDFKDKKNKKRLISFCISIIGIFMLVIGSSTAYLTFQISGSENTITAGTLALSLPSEGNSLSLTNALPTPDVLGLREADSYTFELNSTSNITTYYELRLIDNCVIGTATTVQGGSTVAPDVCVPNNYIKVGVKVGDGEYQVVSLGPNGLMATGYLSGDIQNTTIDIKIWLSESTPNTYQGVVDGANRVVVYSGKVQLYARQILDGEIVPSEYDYTRTFSYINSAQEWVVPYDGYYEIELWGAQGGGESGTSIGGSTKGIITLNGGEVLYVYTGEMGLASNTTCATNSNTFNGGGGRIAVSSYCGNQGGGATDIRCFYDPATEKCVSNTNNLTWNDDLGLNSRIMVAGGGGGEASGGTLYGNSYGGNIIGGSPIYSDYQQYLGNGGTQISGGSAPTKYSGVTANGTEGGFGIGGNGGANISSTTSGGGSGGGGGYYGGSGSSGLARGTWPGGGGSSFISGYLGCVAIAEQLTPGSTRTPRLDSNDAECTELSAASDIECSYHYSAKVFTSGEMSAGVNTNNGHAKITYKGISLE